MLCMPDTGTEVHSSAAGDAAKKLPPLPETPCSPLATAVVNAFVQWHAPGPEIGAPVPGNVRCHDNTNHDSQLVYNHKVEVLSKPDMCCR